MTTVMSEPMRVLIVDDEALARAYLAEQLALIDGIVIVGQAANGFEAVKMAEELSPDLMLLDVQMPKLSGFEVLELLGENAPAVVFITAHDEFALRAFEVHAVDYLMKPVEPPRLIAAIQRVAERLATKAPAPAAHELAEAARPPGRPLERVLVREGGRVHVLPVDKIDFVEAQLDKTRFVRIHRSFLLNVERLARIEPYAKDSWLAVLQDGTRLPVSRTGYSRLKELIG